MYLIKFYRGRWKYSSWVFNWKRWKINSLRK